MLGGRQIGNKCRRAEQIRCRRPPKDTSAQSSARVALSSTEDWLRDASRNNHAYIYSQPVVSTTSIGSHIKIPLCKLVTVWPLANLLIITITIRYHTMTLHCLACVDCAGAVIWCRTYSHLSRPHGTNHKIDEGKLNGKKTFSTINPKIIGFARTFRWPVDTRSGIKM